jgi:hypothetical protein
MPCRVQFSYGNLTGGFSCGSEYYPTQGANPGVDPGACAGMAGAVWSNGVPGVMMTRWHWLAL